MKLLITGANGFLGSHFKNHFEKSNKVSEVLTISRKGDVTAHIDILDEFKVRQFLREHKPDCIIHLAANPLTKLDEKNPTEIVQTNVIGTQNLLHYAPEGCRFLLASSIVVYGDLPNRFQEHLVCKPTSVYAVTKLAAEGLVNSYSSMNRVSGVSFRMCATVGKDLTHGILMDFIRKAKDSNPKFPVLGAYPGTCKPYAHIDDIVSAFELLMFDRSKINGVYNACPSDEITAFQMANIVLNELKISKEIEFLGNETIWKGDNKLIQASSANLETLGWNRKYQTSKDAVIKTIKEHINL